MTSAARFMNSTGAPVEETTIINRCKKEDTYEVRLAEGRLPE